MQASLGFGARQRGTAEDQPPERPGEFHVYLLATALVEKLGEFVWRRDGGQESPGCDERPNRAGCVACLLCSSRLPKCGVQKEFESHHVVAGKRSRRPAVRSRKRGVKTPGDLRTRRCPSRQVALGRHVSQPPRLGRNGGNAAFAGRRRAGTGDWRRRRSKIAAQRVRTREFLDPIPEVRFRAIGGEEQGLLRLNDTWQCFRQPAEPKSPAVQGECGQQGRRRRQPAKPSPPLLLTRGHRPQNAWARPRNRALAKAKTASSRSPSPVLNW